MTSRSDRTSVHDSSDSTMRVDDRSKEEQRAEQLFQRDRSEQLSAAIKEVVNQEDVKYGAGGINQETGKPYSWCNKAAFRIGEKMGQDLTPFYDKGVRDYTAATEFYNAAEDLALNPASGVYKLDSGELAQAIGNTGGVVFVCRSDHMAVVRPSEKAYDPKDGPQLGQAGKTVTDSISTAKAFGDVNSVSYYFVDRPAADKPQPSPRTDASDGGPTSGVNGPRGAIHDSSRPGGDPGRPPGD